MKLGISIICQLTVKLGQICSFVEEICNKIQGCYQVLSSRNNFKKFIKYFILDKFYYIKILIY